MLIPAVAELLRTGSLHPYDAEWVGRLKPESQLAAAQRCMKPNPTFDAAAVAKSGISHGHRSRQN